MRARPAAVASPAWPTASRRGTARAWPPWPSCRSVCPTASAAISATATPLRAPSIAPRLPCCHKH
eukprot:6190245-Pleurochrysis_carterae.AAC.1